MRRGVVHWSTPEPTCSVRRSDPRNVRFRRFRALSVWTIPRRRGGPVDLAPGPGWSTPSRAPDRISAGEKKVWANARSFFTCPKVFSPHHLGLSRYPTTPLVYETRAPRAPMPYTRPRPTDMAHISHTMVCVCGSWHVALELALRRFSVHAEIGATLSILWSCYYWLGLRTHVCIVCRGNRYRSTVCKARNSATFFEHLRDLSGHFRRSWARVLSSGHDLFYFSGGQK